MTLLPQATRSHLNDTSHILCRSITSRRLISSSASLCQARERIRSVASDSLLRRPCLRKDNPYLPATYLIGVHPDGVSLQDTSRYPIRIPRAAVDPKLLKSAPVPRPSHQAMDPHPDASEVLYVRETGETQVLNIVEDWVRNELNAMGTIREKTIIKFIQLLLNPSTLAPLAVGLKLRTDGEKRPTKASLHAPARIVPAVTHADIELTQLFYYYIGSLYHSLPKTSSPGSPPPLLKTHLLDLLQSGLPHTSPAKLLIRASELSGQSVVGLKKGHARAELRVAHLSIWGERRSKKLKKLVPEQKCHRNVLHVRKAELLKQRWRDEELKMIHWRRRVLQVTEAQKADAEAERLGARHHARKLAEWTIKNSQPKVIDSPNPGFFSKLFNFWQKPAAATSS